MEVHNTNKFTVRWKGRIYLCDSVEYLARGAFTEELTAGGECISRRCGSRPAEIILRGKFAPEEKSIFTDMIRNFNTTEDAFVVDNRVVPQPVLLTGRVVLRAGSELGEFMFRFGEMSYGI